MRQTPKAKELNDADYDRIKALSEQGNALFENQQIRPALRKYEQALEIVPEPKTDWEAGTWLYTSIGDAHFALGETEQAKNSYYDALNSPEGLSNAYIHLSLGQVLFELEESEKSQQSLLRAYMIDGDEIFEDEDPKYRKSIHHLIDEDDTSIDNSKPKREYIYKDFTRYYRDEDGNLIEDN